MLNISRKHSRYISIQEKPALEMHRIRHSDGWTTDKLPRQGSMDYIGMKDYGAHIGLPDQIKYMPDVWIRLTEKIQRWLFDVECLSCFGKLYQNLTGAEKNEALFSWAEFLDDGRCFTNGTGTDSRHDYINGTHTTAPDMEWEPLLTGGNFLELTGRTKQIPTTYLNYGRKSYLHYGIRGVDINNLPAPADFLKDRAVCHTPTTIKPTGEKGVFPQFRGKAVYPIWGEAWVWEGLLV